MNKYVYFLLGGVFNESYSSLCLLEFQPDVSLTYSTVT